MKKLILICAIICGSALQIGLFAQSAETNNKLDVSIHVENNGKWRTLIPVIAEGSGDYLYLWTSTAKFGIAADPSSKEAVVPLDNEDITYRVFVRDQKSGALGHKSINFSKINGKVGSVAYPNPSNGELTISLTNNDDIVLDNKQSIVKADLYSEKSGRLVKSLNLPSAISDEFKIDTGNLQPGVYYVHLWIKDNVHSEALKKEIRVLVENR